MALPVSRSVPSPRPSRVRLALVSCAVTVALTGLPARPGAAQDLEPPRASVPRSDVAAVRVPQSELDATIANAPEDRVSDQQIRHVDAGGMNLGVGVVHRPVTTTLSAIQHHRQAEIYRVVEGRGVLVTSPDLVDAAELDPEGTVVRTLTGPSSTGTIEGGASMPIAPGDVVFIPAGVAHGFSEITEPITYIVYRVDPEKLVELKGGSP